MSNPYWFGSVRVPREWRLRDAALAAFLMLALSWGFVALFPYDRVILGPLTGVGGFSLLIILLVLATWFLLMAPRHGRWRDVLAILLALGCVFVILTLRIHWTPGIDPLADRDEALEVAWRGLASGSGPYSAPTPIGNPISPLLGGVLLFTPFELLGATELFDVVAAVVLTALLFRYCGWRPATALVTLLLASAPFRWEVLIQSDGWINAALVALAAVWSARALSGLNGTMKSRISLGLASVLLVLAVCYRIHFALILLPLAAWVWRSVPPRTALTWLLSVGLASALLVLVPFLVWPTPYGPQHVAGLFDVSDVGGPVLAVAALSGALLLWALTWVHSVVAVLRWTALALLTLIVLLGLSQTDWTSIAEDPVGAVTAYPPVVLGGFGSYPLTAHNAGILLIGLLSLVAPVDLARRPQGEPVEITESEVHE